MHYTTSRNVEGTIAWFQDPRAQVSAHYIIGREGEIYQMVRDSDKAWHAKDANANSIGIEHSAAAGNSMTRPRRFRPSPWCAGCSANTSCRRLRFTGTNTLPKMSALRIARTTSSGKLRKLPSLDGCRPTSETAACSRKPRSGRIVVFLQTTPHGHIIAVAFFMTFAYVGWSAPGAAQQSHTEVAVEGPFHGKKLGKRAKDLSGIACQPLVGGEHTCLVVNDESPFAQLATVRDRRLIAGRDSGPHRRPRSAPSRQCAVGGGIRFGGGGQTPIAERCPDRSIEEDFDEFDGEGVAWASGPSGGVFYVVGSHSCGRKHNRRRRSTHLLARFRADGNGRLSEPAELTWRLGEALKHADPVSRALWPASRPKSARSRYRGNRRIGRWRRAAVRATSAIAEWACVYRSCPRRRSLRPRRGGGPAQPGHKTAVDPGDRYSRPRGTSRRTLAGPVRPGARPDRCASGAFAGCSSDQPVWEADPLLPRIEAANADAKAEGLAVLAAADGTLRVLILFENPAKDPPLEYVLSLPVL